MQPIVIVGGFLSYAAFYRGLAASLSALSDEKVFITPIQSYHWLPAVSSLGWRQLLGELDRTVSRAVRISQTGKVTLIGHSIGGVLARLYLSPELFWGRRYAGLRKVDRLITLGSPHGNRGRIFYGGSLSRLVEKRCPGACFEPQVKYISVAGRAVQGNPDGMGRERWTAKVYRDLCGDGTAWGDGLIPIPSALLRGSQPIVLMDAHHTPAFGGPWYGSKEMIARWWSE